MTTSLLDRSVRAAACLCLGAAALLASCATERAATKGPEAPPKVVTVSQLKTMLDEGTTIAVIFGEIQGSGTVYRLTLEQSRSLRAEGMPGSMMSMIESTYANAIRRNPDLAKSDDKWTNIDGYWYGGLPFGWPPEWVNAPPPSGR